MKRSKLQQTGVLVVTLAIVGALGPGPVQGAVSLREICRVKGQEENVLQGLGLVVGLSGTGDGGKSLPTMRVLANSMKAMGNPLGPAAGRGQGGLAELKDAKNVALVWVTATVPPTGGRRGDHLNCSVSAMSASSLKGGRLVYAAMQSKDLKSPQLYGFSQGLIHLDDATTPTEGKIHGGCQLEEDFFHPYAKDGKITLVLDKHHAGFSCANEVARNVNAFVQNNSRPDRDGGGALRDEELARAIGPANIEIRIPEQYRDAMVDFVAQVLEVPMSTIPTESRVTINERSGTIVIDGEVEIGSVVITHKNFRVETGEKTEIQSFAALEPTDEPGTRLTPQLQALLESLNALGAEPAEMIDIIKTLHRNGNLHAPLIIE